MKMSLHDHVCKHDTQPALGLWGGVGMKVASILQGSQLLNLCLKYPTQPSPCREWPPSATRGGVICIRGGVGIPLGELTLSKYQDIIPNNSK